LPKPKQIINLHKHPETMADPTLLAEVQAMVDMGIPATEAFAGILENRRIQAGITNANSNFLFVQHKISQTISSTFSIPIRSLHRFRLLFFHHLNSIRRRRYVWIFLCIFFFTSLTPPDMFLSSHNQCLLIMWDAISSLPELQILRS
jgi:hypothetical protein